MAKERTTRGGKALLQELKIVAEQLGIQVREEKLLREVGYRVRGGGCRVRGQHVVFLDRDLPLAERIEIMLDELARHDLDPELLSPPLRRLLEGVSL